MNGYGDGDGDGAGLLLGPGDGDEAETNITSIEAAQRRSDLQDMAENNDQLLDVMFRSWIPRLRAQFDGESEDFDGLGTDPMPTDAATTMTTNIATAGATNHTVTAGASTGSQTADTHDTSGGTSIGSDSEPWTIETSHGSYVDFYLMACSELLYFFRAEPEQANELDSAWMVEQLQQIEIDLSDQDEASLEAIFDDAAKIYEEYEEQRIANLLVENPDQMEHCDIKWLRQALGYTSPPPDADDEFAINVWTDMWQNSKTAITLQHATESAAEPPSVSSADATASATSTAHPSQSIELIDEPIEADLHAPQLNHQYINTAQATIGDPTSFCETTGAMQDPAFKIDADLLERSNDPVADTEAAVGVSLVRAVAAEGDNQVKKAFQSALHSRQAEAKAEGKYQASLSGNMEYTLNTTRGLRGEEHKYLNAKTSRGRPSVDETVQLIPYQLLIGIVRSIATDPDETVRDR